MQAAELYDLDFAEWARWNAELLRSGRVAEADLEHIAEEIEDMGKRERRALYHRFVRLIEHLLKWEYQPERRGTSWERTIITQRKGLQRLLDENPSFWTSGSCRKVFWRKPASKAETAAIRRSNDNCQQFSRHAINCEIKYKSD
jgi:hypothetical protein